MFCFHTKAQTIEECNHMLTTAINEIFQKADYANAIKRLHRVETIAKTNNYKKEYFLAKNNLGAAYYNMLDYGNAIKFYLQAYEVAIANENIVDEMSVLNNIAIVYARDSNREKAKEYFQKSFEIALEKNYADKASLYASNLAKLYFEDGDIENTKKYLNIVILYKNEANVAVQMNAVCTQNKLLLLQNAYDKVIQNTIKNIATAKQYELHELVSELEIILTKAYIGKKDFSKATTTVTMALKTAANNSFKVDLYELKSLIALKTNNIKAIYAAKDSIVQLNNTINLHKNRDILVNSKLKFELASSNHELAINKEKTESQQKVFRIVTFFLVILILVISWAFYKRNQVSKQKRILYEQSLQITDLELEREKQKTHLLNQELKEKELRNELEKEKLKEKELQLKQEIAQNNKQLSDKILFQNTRNELIENIISKVSDLPEIKKDNQLHQSIVNLKLHLREDTKWEEFTTNFESVNSDFIRKLKNAHTNLTANDVRFLSFIYLNLSYKEIAALLNITPESCRKRKERVSKKLNFSGQQSLYEYLSSL